MKFYIATGLERADAHNLVRDYLVRLGHTITYDWTVHGSVQAEGIERIQQVALAEKQGVLDADVVVVLLPGGRGTHTELGMALASGKPVFMHGQDSASFLDDNGRTCAFYHDPLVFRCHLPLQEMLDLLDFWLDNGQPDHDCRKHLAGWSEHYDRQPDNCSCHINPPCNACVTAPDVCTVCGAEFER